MALSYELSLTILRDLKDLGAKVSAYAALLRGLRPEERATLLKHARISTIGASTRIENALLTDAQIEWIDTVLTADGKATAFTSRREQISSKIAKDRERSLEEVAGCREMLAVIYSQAKDLYPLTETTLRGLHHEALKYYEPAHYHLGRYKLNSNRVVERGPNLGERVVLEPTSPGSATDTAMAELLPWYNANLAEHPWSVAVVCEFVFRFLAIHPFQDGNGRVGRGLFLLGLLQSSDADLTFLAPYLAIDRQIEKHKEQYYMVLAQCSGGCFRQDPREYKIGLFLSFMTRMLLLSLGDIDFNRRRHEAMISLSPSARAVFGCFQENPETRLQTKDICAQTKFPRRTVVQVLGTLVKNGLLQKQGQGAGVRYQLVF